MKKIILVLAASITTFCFSSCTTTKIALEDYAPMAIIGVEGNPTILEVNEKYEKDEKTSGALSSLINKNLNGSNPEIMTAQDRIDYADECLRLVLEEIGNVKVLDKEIVVNCKNYKNITSDILSFGNTNLVAPDYKKSTLNPGAKNMRLIIKDTKAKSVLSVLFEFDKQPVFKGIKAVVKMRVHIFDENGRRLIQKDYMSVSEPFESQNGHYNKEEFVELFPAVIENVINKFVMDYIK